jgi:hypothetical protein
LKEYNQCLKILIFYLFKIFVFIVIFIFLNVIQSTI